MTEGLQLKIAQGTSTLYNRDVVKVEYENYETLKQISDGKYSAGMVTLHITEALDAGYQYTLSAGQDSLIETFTEMPEGYTAKNKFEPSSFGIGATEAQGRVFAKDDTNNISLIYEFKIVVDPSSPTTWPKLTALSLTEGLQLKIAQGTSTLYNRDVVKVEYENYETLKQISDGKYSAGMVTLHMCGDASVDSTSVRNTATNPRPSKKVYFTKPL